ncbi:MAG: DUF1232 domain-containing protein [Nitrospirae bacterium]|nr:DUF1232 domain-containing protein [Nitrospirota bacterium]
MILISELRKRAHLLKAETFALYLAMRDPRTPWYAKLVLAVIVAYVLSPIDLIPDFLPVLGYLDDLILVPIGIAVAIKLIPDSVMADCRSKAAKTIQKGKRLGLIAGSIIIVIWLVLAGLMVMWIYQAVK